MRIICKAGYIDHTEPLFKNLNILPLQNLFIYKVIKIFYNRASSERSNVRCTDRVLRSKLNVFVPKPNMTLYKKFYSYLAPRFFNLLPDTIKQIDRENEFLRAIKVYLNQINDISFFFETLV